MWRGVCMCVCGVCGTTLGHPRAAVDLIYIVRTLSNLMIRAPPGAWCDEHGR